MSQGREISDRVLRRAWKTWEPETRSFLGSVLGLPTQCLSDLGVPVRPGRMLFLKEQSLIITINFGS